MVISDSVFWLVTLCIGLGTFFLRAVFVFALERIHLTEKAKVMLGFIPPAVLSALVLPAFLLPGGHLPFPDGWERTVAGLAAHPVECSPGDEARIDASSKDELLDQVAHLVVGEGGHDAGAHHLRSRQAP